jgi:hypothetical protein
MSSAAALLRTSFEAGNTRQRRTHAGLPTEITLTWRCANVDLYPLLSWLNVYGYDWFTIGLAGLEASMLDFIATPIIVRCLGDLKVSLMQFHRANWWTVEVGALYLPPLEALTYADDSQRETQDAELRITEGGDQRLIEG